MSLRDRQIRETLDEDLRAYKEVYVRELKQARLFNESYTPPNRFERQVAFQIDKYFIEFQRTLDEIINSNQPDQKPINDGGAIIQIYSELVSYLDNYTSRNTLNQRDVATIEEKFDALLPSLSQVVNISQEQEWVDNGVLEELYSLVEDRVYLPLNEALARLPTRKRMLVNRQGFNIVEDRRRAKQEQALALNQAVARGADFRRAMREGEAPPEYFQGDFPYVPPDQEEDEEPVPVSFQPASQTPTRRRAGPKSSNFYKKFRDEIQAQSILKNNMGMLGDLGEFGKIRKIGTLRNLLSDVSGFKKGSPEYKALIEKIEAEPQQGYLAQPQQDLALAEEQQQGLGLPSAMRPKQHIRFDITEKEGKGHNDMSRFAIRSDGRGLSGGFGETEGQMGGLPLGMRSALQLRQVDRQPAPKHYGSVGTPEQDLTIEKRMFFLNQLESHKVRDDDEEKDFNSIANLRKMMEKRLKKRK